MEKKETEEKALEMLQALFNENAAEPYEMAQAALRVIDKETFYGSQVRECLAWFCVETAILLGRKLEEEEYEYSDCIEWEAAITEILWEAKRGGRMKNPNTLSFILEEQIEADKKNK